MGSTAEGVDVKHVITAATIGFSLVVTSSAVSSDEQVLAALRSAETVRLVVEQTYGFRSRNRVQTEPIPGVSLSFEEVAESLLRGAGVEVVGPAAQAYDATLTITARGKALGALYFEGVKGYLYAGAALEGTIAFAVRGLPPHRRDFRTELRPLGDVTLNLGYELPRNAPFHELLDRTGSFIPRIMELIGEVYGADAVIAALEGGEPAIRRSAAKVLGELGDPAAGEALITALQERDAKVRWQSAWALGKIGDPRAVEPLIAALEDRDLDVRWFAAWALVAITGERLGDEPDAWAGWWAGRAQ
ncbi:MAG: HEAT repeat domain-containing protein [Alphaproteobacteria bacterium]